MSGRAPRLAANAARGRAHLGALTAKLSAKRPIPSPVGHTPHGTTDACIRALEVYAPQHCVSAAAADACGGYFGKHICGLLVERFTTCGEDEDAASMVLTALTRLMRRCGVRSCEVGKLQIGSEAPLDRSKSIKTELMSLVESAHADLEGVDHCEAATSSARALLDCGHWVRGETWDGRWAIVVSLEPPIGTAGTATLIGRAAAPTRQYEYVSQFTHRHGLCGRYAPIGEQQVRSLVSILRPLAYHPHASLQPALLR